MCTCMCMCMCMRMRKHGQVFGVKNSLNVACCASIVLYEVLTLTPTLTLAPTLALSHLPNLPNNLTLRCCAAGGSTSPRSRPRCTDF